MKTIRIVGMVFATVFFIANFLACSKNDAELKVDSESGIVADEKKIVEIKQSHSFGDKYTTLFTYDNKKRLTRLLIGNGEPIDVVWGNDLVMYGFISYNLNKGLIDNEQCEYNSSNQLISYGNEFNRTLCTWENGNLIKCTSKNGLKEFFYSNKTYKGYFPLIASAFLYVVDGQAISYNSYGLFIAHPELLGIRTKQLPDKIIETSNDGLVKDVYLLEYTFVNDGYIESCTIKNDYYYKGDLSHSSTMIATFKWK